jgi:glycosyltransferase involved in cell wall biosynthesis
MLVLHINKVYKNFKAEIPNLKRSERIANLSQNTILLVGMVESPHFQKWLNALKQELPNKKILVFPSDRPRFNRKKLNVLKKENKSTRIFQLLPNGQLNFIAYYFLDTVIGVRWRAYFLARLIIAHKPAINHFHEMQHGAYIFNLIANYRKIPSNSRNIISTWGSDLTLYSWVDGHQTHIRSCLNWVDVLTAEKEVEIKDAKRFGFKGEFRAPIYITIGQKHLSNLAELKTSSRKLILVKGHQSDTGLALNVLSVISKMENVLQNFEIIVYSAPESVQLQVDLLRNKNKINIKTLKRVSHHEMLDLFAQARISISLAVSDGLPGALVEAMQAGAFPIQSENSAAGKFLDHGINGFVVNPWNLELIQELLQKAITEDDLVDRANELNKEVLKQKYSYRDGLSKLRSLYL